MTTMTERDPLVAHPCPEWCSQHTDWQTSERGRPVTREHIGPRFGCFVVLGEQDWVTGETTLDVHVIGLEDVRASADWLHAYADDARAAAAWIETHS